MAEQEIAINVNDCPLKQVTVYSDRAEITRDIFLTNVGGVNAGRKRLVVTGLVDLLDTSVSAYLSLRVVYGHYMVIC